MKAERRTKSRIEPRARRVRAHSGSKRILVILNALIAQVKKGSPRAIATLGVIALILVGVPLGIILLSTGQPVQAAMPPLNGEERVVLDTGTLAFSADTQEQPTDMVVPTPSPTPAPHPDNTVLKRGMNAPVVMEIQERLMELGYMDWDEPTDFFGPNTRESVLLFQRKHELTMDGCVGQETYALLMSDQATKYSVSIGVEGTDVEELQIRLRELGYLDKATQYFGTDTEAAVKKFQERNGLSADGTVGEKTREMLYSEDAKANYFEKGEVSETLKKYQNRLKKLGYLTTEADGKYGADTENAVKRFQERSGLIADGYMGPQTISMLMSGDAQANALMIGMKGSDVEKIQSRLKELKYLKSVDGYFGQDTEAAVRSFQSRNGLSADGKVGKNTMNSLMSSSAKKASSSSSGSSSGSSGGSSSGGSGSSSGGSSGGSVKVGNGANVETFIAVAESKIGSKYVRGAKGPNQFDCSGFVYWCLNQAGVKQGYMTSGSWQKTTKYQRISGMDNLKRGDVVSFKGHVGIYLGGGKMIDASSSQGKIRICTNIQGSAYWKRTFVCGFRIF